MNRRPGPVRQARPPATETPLHHRVTGREAADAIYLAAVADATSVADDRGTAGGRPEGDGPGDGEPDEPAVPPTPSWGAGADQVAESVVGETSRDGTPRALPDRQRLVEALRPFHAFHPDPHTPHVDREATARTYARTLLALRAGAGAGRPLPDVPVRAEWAGADRRAVRLVILADRSLSMRLRDHTVAEFVTLAERSRAFAAVPVWTFDSDTPDLRLRHPGSGRIAGAARALLTGRAPQAVLVLTDGVGTGWHDGTCHAWLAELARESCVGLVHLLEPERWPMTGVGPEATELLQAHTPNPRPCPNRSYRARHHPTGHDAPGERGHAANVWVPVLELRPESLNAWAEFVMGGAARGWTVEALHLGDGVPGPSTPPEASPSTDATMDDDETVDETAAALAAGDPAAAVRAFRAGASPDAFRLAVALAAVPLPSAVLRFVCAESLRNPEPTELTEVLFGGLAELHENDPLGAWDHAAVWDFRTGVREALLSAGARRSALRRFLRRMSEAFDGHDPWFGMLRHLLDGEPVESALSPVSVRLAEGSRAALGLTLAPERYRELRDGLENHRLQVAADERRRQRRGLATLGTAQQRAGPPGAPVPLHGTGTTPRYDDPPLATTLTPTGDDMSSSIGPSGEFPDITTDRTQPSRRREAAPQIIGGNIPRRNPAFTGREEMLRRLHDHLTSGSGQSVLSALHGMPGVGKSALAAEFAYQHSSDYEFIWWIDAAHVHGLNEGYSGLAQSLKLDLSSTGPKHLVQAVKQALQRGEPFRGWLLIFDNAEDPEELRSYLPVHGPGHILITTRNQVWTGPGGSRVPIDVFTPEESVALLRKRGPEDLTDEDAARLAERLGHLPAALDQAAVWLYETGLPVSEFLTQVEQQEDRLLTALEPTDPHYTKTIVAVLNVCLNRLERTSPGALDLLHVCSLFDPAPIPIDLFHFARDVGAPPDLRDILEEVERLSRVLRELRRAGLIQLDHRNRTLRLHRVLRLTLRDRRSPEDLETYQNCAHLLLAKSDPGSGSQSAWERHAELLPHLWSAKIWLSSDPWARELIINAVKAAALRGDNAESKRLGETTHTHWVNVYGENDLNTMRLAVRMARSLRDLGESDAAGSLARHTMETSAALYGPEDDLTLDAAREYLRVLRFTGDFQESEDLAADTYHKRLRSLDEDDPATLTAQHEYAYALLLNGKPQEGLQLFEDVYRRREMQLGRDALPTIAAMDGYLDCLMELGDYRGALEQQHTLTNRLRSIEGDRSLGSLTLSRTLAMMLRRAGHIDQARRLAEYAYQKIGSLVGPDNFATISSAIEYAAALSARDENDKAMEIAVMSLKKTTEVLGSDHPYTAMAEMNYATILRRMRRFSESRPLDESALRTFESRFGNDHPFTISCSINVANDLAESSELTAAIELEERIVQRCREIFPDQHPTLLLALRNLTLDRASAGENVQEEIAKIEQMYQEILGSEHPATLSIRHRARENADNYIPML